MRVGDYKHFIGKPVEAIETPALLVEKDIMESNMDKMMSFLRPGTVGLRPHTKTHKTPDIARIQMEKGAVGITCAKLGEAEVLAQGGICEILVANQVIGKHKCQRAASLAENINLIVAVDQKDNVIEMSEAACENKSIIGVLIEVDVGLGRSGVRTEAQAVELAKLICSLPGVRYDGIMGYEGHCVFIEKLEERKKEAEKAYARLFEFVHALKQAGFSPDIVSTGGTGTFLFGGRKEGVTDIQAGSYIFMDNRYMNVEGIEFSQSLSVLSTIVSHPEPGIYVCDAGLKSMSQEFGLVSALPGYNMQVVSMSEEHVKLKPADSFEFPNKALEV